MGHTKGSIQCYWLSGPSPRSGEIILGIASISLSTARTCPSLSSQQNSAVTSLNHLLRLAGWLRSTVDLRLPSCRSYGLSNPAKVPLRGGAGANSHTRVIWRFIWKPTIYLNSGPSSSKEKIEIVTSVPLINAQQHSWKEERTPSESISVSAFFIMGVHSTLHLPWGHFLLPRHYSQTQNQGWQEKDLLSTSAFHSEIALKEPGNLGDIFSWEDLTGALVRTTS